jgi:RNA polymerase sigma factor (sigma-70 family)
MVRQTYNRWLKLALVISKGNKFIAEEVLHIVLLELLTKFDINNVTDNYIFMALKNRYISFVKAESKHEGFNLSLDKEDDNTYVEGDHDNQLSLTKKILHGLDEADKQIFTLHFTRGFSQRKISREMGLRLYHVISRVKYIKQLIKQDYEKSKETSSKACC